MKATYDYIPSQNGDTTWAWTVTFTYSDGRMQTEWHKTEEEALTACRKINGKDWVK